MVMEKKTATNRLCKTWTAVSDGRLMVAHARILLPIKLLKNHLGSFNSPNHDSNTQHLKHFFCTIRGSYVPYLVKIGPQITSQSCPQTPDGRTFT